MRIVLVSLALVGVLVACGTTGDGICGGQSKCLEPSPGNLDDGGLGASEAGHDDGRADASPTPTHGGRCGKSTCAADEICIPGCAGICQCAPTPDSGICEDGPCGCGAKQGCAVVPPPHCEKTVPSECRVNADGTVTCMCA